MNNTPVGIYPNDPSEQEDNTSYKFEDLDNVEVGDGVFSYAEINGRPLSDNELADLGDNYQNELRQMI